MKASRFAIIVAVLALAVSIAVLVRQVVVSRSLVEAICESQEQRCNRNCDGTLRETADRIFTERIDEFGLHTERLFGCPSIDIREATQCRSEEIARHREVQAALDARQAAADRAFILCRATCSRKALDCRGEDAKGALAGDRNVQPPPPAP